MIHFKGHANKPITIHEYWWWQIQNFIFSNLERGFLTQNRQKYFDRENVSSQKILLPNNPAKLTSVHKLLQFMF
jgi:hypothetical protein